MTRREQPIACVSVLALATTIVVGGVTDANPAPAVEPKSCKLVKTARDLQAMRLDLTATYCLANDIDLSSIDNFFPIGTIYNSFRGSLFGRNHVISNLKTSGPTPKSTVTGLFGWHVGRTIQDVHLVNVDVFSSHGFVGGLVGLAQGVTISNVSVTGKVRCVASWYCEAGGLAGTLAGTLADSWSSANVSAKTGIPHTTSAGSLIGYFQGEIRDSFATGNALCVADNYRAGGLIGTVGFGSLLRTYATGAVSSAGAGSSAGGLVGRNGTAYIEYGSAISQSFATGPITGGDSSRVGGLVGLLLASGSVDRSYSVGALHGGGAVGGLIGQVDGMPLSPVLIGTSTRAGSQRVRAEGR